MAIPVIYQGDDTNFNGTTPLSVSLSTDFDLDGHTVTLWFCGCRRDFTGLTGRAATLPLSFSAKETGGFPIGTHNAQIAVFDATGRKRTASDSVRIRVTDDLREAYGAEGEQDVDVEIEMGVDPARLMEGQTLRTNTPNGMRQAIKKIAQALGATVSVLAVAALPVFGASVQTAPLGELDLDQNPSVVTNVDLSGLLTEHQTLGPSTNYTDAALGAFAATGTVARAATYGTPNRWVDATGCVWEATADKAPWTGGPSSPLLWSDNHGGWISNPSTDLLTWDSGTWSLASGALTTTFTCSGEWDAMRLVLHNEGDGTVILERGLLTNFVGRVALTNDIPAIPAETDPTVPAWAKAQYKPTYTAVEVGATDGESVTNIVRGMSLCGIWDDKLGVWWTPHMSGGAYYWTATTNVNLSAEGNQ